jgi:hypothetical protein
MKKSELYAALRTELHRQLLNIRRKSGIHRARWPWSSRARLSNVQEAFPDDAAVPRPLDG